MTELISEKNIDKPPLFKKWKNLYAFIVLWLIFLITLFSLFTNAY